MTVLSALKTHVGALALTPSLAIGLAGCERRARPSVTEMTGPDDLAVGRHLVKVGGCNDCHTANYLVSDVSESEWLKDVRIGFKVPLR